MTRFLSTEACILSLLPTIGCQTTVRVDNSPGRPTKYEDPGSPGRVTGYGFESQDLIAVTDQVVRDIFASPPLAERAQSGQVPRIVIDSKHFSNESSTPINVNLFTERLLNELGRAASGRLTFVTRERLDMLDEEAAAQREGKVGGAAQPLPGPPLGWDYRLTGRFLSIDVLAPDQGMRSRSHQITFQLWDRRGELVWSSKPFEVKKSGQEGYLYR